MTIAVNQPAVYVEVMEDGSSKRFILPAEEGIEEKAKAYVNAQSNLSIIRIGSATVTSEADDAESAAAKEGLVSIPSTVEKVYKVDMPGHPILASLGGTARYSSEFIKSVEEVEVKQEVVVAPVIDKKEDLTQQLKQQMNQEPESKQGAAHPHLTDLLRGQVETQKSDTKVIALPESKEDVKEEPKVEVEVKDEKEEAPVGQVSLDEALAQAKAKKNQALKPRPIGKIDILLEEVAELRKEVAGIQQLLTQSGTSDLSKVLEEIRKVSILLGGE